MKIIIDSTGFELTAPLETYISGKFGALQKLISRFEKEGDLTIRVELRRTTRHHRKGEVYEALADIRLPKKVIRASEKADDARAAIDLAKDVLKTEIEKYKEKMTTIAKREK